MTHDSPYINAYNWLCTFSNNEWFDRSLGSHHKIDRKNMGDGISTERKCLKSSGMDSVLSEKKMKFIAKIAWWIIQIRPDRNAQFENEKSTTKRNDWAFITSAVVNPSTWSIEPWQLWNDQFYLLIFLLRCYSPQKLWFFAM